MKVKEAVEAQAVNLEEVIQKALKKRPMTAPELADLADCSPSKIRQAITEMQRRAICVALRNDGHYDAGFMGESGHLVIKSHDRGDGWIAFGVTTDNHLCNVHSRLDVLNALYKEFANEGVTQVFNCGNAIDGEMKFNKRELVVRPGMDAQVEYWVDKMPEFKAIETLFITGDDHEGWFAQRECINIGDYMQMKAEKSGRTDLKHLGYAEADIELKGKRGSAVLRLMHPGGGSAYAYSYTSQKIVESFQGGEKPAVLLCGHYHKWDNCYPRNVCVVQCGCTCDQTLFMRKKKIEAHVGGVLIKLRQDKTDGHITAIETRWMPFYDRGFYEKRFE
jgi:hypothetical protein